MTNRDNYCRILRDRSVELSRSFEFTYSNGIYSQVVSILRQQLDSMVRAIFLLQIENTNEQNHYIDQTIVLNEKWTNVHSRRIVTDKDMVDAANSLQGWTKSVYKFGCAFIHLSSLLDYSHENLFSKLPKSNHDDIKQHLHDYYDFSLANDLNMTTIKPFLPRVFRKVTDDLESYISGLESGSASALLLPNFR